MRKTITSGLGAVEKKSSHGPEPYRTLLIVAHPDDEILWAGGIMLLQPNWQWHIVCLCRKNDIDRSKRFSKMLDFLGITGVMGDLDDGPEQKPLSIGLVSDTILDLLVHRAYDMVITHSPKGEYTRHLRHEEIGAAVLRLWETQKIRSPELRLFAYGDGYRSHYPLAIPYADICIELPEHIWKIKYSIMINIYGFAPDSWEAMSTPKAEAFWRFEDLKQARKWLDQRLLS